MFYVIIRGPAGVGKSAIAKILAKKINAYHLSFDDILSQHNLDIIEGDGISVKNFIQGNELALDLIKQMNPQTIVFDGCFYRDEQMNHLIDNLNKKHFVFTLKADVDTCKARNKERGGFMPSDAIEDVHKLVSRKDYGTLIDTSGKSIDEVTNEIISHLSPLS